MFGRRKQPRLRDVMKEMSYGSSTELRDPEDIDRELSEEEAEALEENRVAVYLLVHMYRSIGWELTMEPQRAERYARGRSAIRYAVVLLSLIAVMVGLGRTAGIGCILAVVMIKPAAYMQPLTAKIRRKLGVRG